MARAPFQALGLALLATLPAAGQGFSPASRPAWVTSQIYATNHPFAAQLPGELDTKLAKMAVSPFAFYRGTSSLFYSDMRTLPGSAFRNLATDQAWLEGDFHVMNLGAFRTGQGHDVFDTNDFDEGYLGPFTWDLRRMAVSLVLAGKETGRSASDCDALIRTFAGAYLDAMADFKGSSAELGYRLGTSNTSGVVDDLVSTVNNQSRASYLAKYTALDASGHRVFLSKSDLVGVSPAMLSSLQAAMAGYVASIPASKRFSTSYYSVKDVRQKLGSGTGSLGRFRYWVLLEGPSASQSDDVLLEWKQESASSVAAANPGGMPVSAYGAHEGERVARSQKALLSEADPLVGWATANGLPFFVRERSPFAVDFDYTLCSSLSKWQEVAQDAGKVAAKNHASADKDYDATVVSWSMDKEVTDLVASRNAFLDELVAFADAYAQQANLDWSAFLTAYRGGAQLY